MNTNRSHNELKPETRRLIVIDIVVAFACVLQLSKGISYWMVVPVILAQITLLGYGIWLLESRLAKQLHQPRKSVRTMPKPELHTVPDYTTVG
jgi:hypothetical protein